ncbi:MAG: PilZ domain-containing protein [Treponema sp.]|nr:PilZ domain-containing protein [Treponema sp.]
MSFSTTTSLQIAHYYDYFRDKEIVFTKANLLTLKLDPRQIYIKCNGGQWPCILNSSSLQMAKIIIGTQSGAFTEMQKNAKMTVNLKYCFIDQNNQPIHFFVNCSVIDIKPYKGTSELAIVTLEFNQRPPDDLISRIGEFIEASENFINRKEERINVDQNSLRKLGMDKEESIVWVDNVPRRCILKDLSFSGAKIMLVGVPKFLVGKPIKLRFDFNDTNESFIVSGTIPRAEFLEGRKDIASVHVAYNVDSVPMSYKMHINNFITNFQKKFLQQESAGIKGPVISTADDSAVPPVIKEMNAKPQPAQPVQSVKPVQAVQGVQNVQSVQSIKPVQDTLELEPIEDLDF